MSNEKNISKALYFAEEAIELYLALLKKHEPTNAADFADVVDVAKETPDPTGL